jgi:hypothetical protein
MCLKRSHSIAIRKSHADTVSFLVKQHYFLVLATSRANCEWCLLCKYA